MTEKPPAWEIRGLKKSMETTIKKNILRYLNSLPDSHFILNLPGAESGEADITGCIRGRRCEFEVKRPMSPSKTHARLQAHKRKLWAQAGAITGVVNSIHEVRMTLFAHKIHEKIVERIEP